MQTNPAPTPMPWAEAAHLTQSFFDSEHGADYQACCDTSTWAAGMCTEVSEAFADHLHREGETTAVTLDLIAHDEHPYVPAGAAHTVVEVRGTVIDLTHRQFDPDAEVPHAAPAAEYLHGWLVIGRD